MATQITRDGQPLHTRGAAFQAATYNPEKRTVLVSLGTGAPVQRYDWANDSVYTEVLSLEPGDVRLDRLNAGGPFFEDHKSASVQTKIGRFVPGSVRILDGQLVGEVRLSKAARHADTVGDIIDGIISDTSIGYTVARWNVTRDDAGNETRTATDWTPYEGSVVGIPADPTGGIRSQPNEAVHPVPEAATAPAEDEIRLQPGTPMEVFTMDKDQMEALRAEGAKLEAVRQDGIRSLAKKAQLTDEAIRVLLSDPSITVEQAGVRMWDIKAEQAAKDEVRSQVVITRDEGDTQFRAIASALEFKAGVSPTLPENAQHLRGATGLDLAKAFLALNGVRTAGMNPHEIAKAARHVSGTRGVAAHKTTDFTSVYANVGFKSFMAAYKLLPELGWWKDLGIRNDFVSMTNPRYVVKVSGMGVLPTVTEGSAYEGTTQVDSHELVTPIKKGFEFRVTDEMIIDDDISYLLRKSIEFGEAAARTESAMALAALSGTMVDGKAVCHTDHGNLSESGGVPDLTKIAELDSFLRAQTDGNGNVIGRGAKIALLPDSNTVRTVVEQLYSDRLYASDPTDIPTVALERRYIPGLATAWYLATGNPIAMEYGYLQGEGGPAISNYEQPGSDATIYHVRDVFGIAVIEHRDFAKNPGA